MAGNLYLVFVIVLLTQFIFGHSQSDCPKDLPCNDKKNCDECIQYHHCCNWCLDEVYGQPRCNLKNKLHNCINVEQNSRSSVSFIESKKLMDVNEDANEAVQITPQRIKLKLRKGDPVKFKIHYRLAKDYPLDLYYLMDLTYTMRRDVETLTKLGTEMADVLHTLTKNHRMAFGAYSDKVALPYYDTSDNVYNNPCSSNDETCEPGFDFRHHQHFTSDINEVIQKINNTKTTANLDNLEGGLDALMQIMVCGRFMNWLTDSRKIILVATDGILHMAGEGLLAGAIKRNVDSCRMDSKGDYSKSLVYDYPSLEEVYHKLVNTKTNVVFAVKRAVRNYYEEIKNLISDVVYVVELEERSENIIGVVKEGYHNFIKNVRFSVNTSFAPELEIKFESTCNTKFINATSACYDVKEGVNYAFDITVELAEHPANKMEETIVIEEKSIREAVLIDIEYVGSKCRCKLSNDVINFPQVDKCNLKGEWKCNQCYCIEGWTGPNCTEQCGKSSREACRMKVGDYVSSTCSSRGDCDDCGKCVCDYGYTGKYCEYACPLYQKLVCAEHGKCYQGKCICDDGYVGDTCSCPISKETCKLPGQSSICKDRGTCECGKCNCQAGFSGDFCEKCAQCDGLCSTYQECVIKNVDSFTGSCTNPDATSYQIGITKTKETLKETDQGDVCYVRFENEKLQRCEIYYTYSIEKDMAVKFVVKNECWYAIKPAMAASVIIGIILVVGILGIIAWKLRLVVLERKEYKKFEMEMETQREKIALKSEVNPIFKPATTSYEMPVELQMIDKTKYE